MQRDGGSASELNVPPETVGVAAGESKVAVTASAVRAIIADQFRKLKHDSAKAHKDADHHKLLAHTVSKSFAVAISENEQLQVIARVAQQSAQTAQQESRHYQAEAHRLQKKLDQALQLTTKPQSAISEQVPTQELAAAKGRGHDAQQAENTCQQMGVAYQSLQHRDAATQTEASVIGVLLKKQETTSDLEASGFTPLEARDKAFISALGLQHRVAPLQVELEAVRSELLAIQQAAHHGQDNRHALMPVHCMLQQTEVSLQSIAKLHQDMQQAVLSFPGLKQLETYVRLQSSSTRKPDLEHANDVHKRRQQDDCESSGKRQKVQADAAA